jgi:methionine-rich copper-binding protein CopC
VPVTVTLGFDGTATNGTDYTPSATSITISANTLSGSMNLIGIADALVEGNETVVVAIASAPGVAIGSPSTVTANIVDDDAAPGVPTVQWTAAAQTVAEGVVAQVTAQLSAATTLDVTVPFTIGGTATPATDFTTNLAPLTPLTIPSGSTSASVTVNMIHAGTPEPDETITFTMGAPTNATRGTTVVHTVMISGSGETAPIVSTTTPASSGTNVGIQSNVTITFNEPVTVTGSWFEIVCATSGTRTVANSVVSGSPTIFTIDPNTDFAVGELCTATVFAAQVTDNDQLDPPDTMAANHVFSFTTDSPPAVSTTTPANGATGVLANSNIVVNVTEPVTVTGTSFTVTCGEAQAVSVSGSGTNQITLDPTVDLPATTTCTVTVLAAQVADVDTGDPPDLMTADFLFSFTTVDAAPTVTTTSPANNATDVATSTNITINFSEPVTYGTSSFTITCGGVQAFSLAGASTSTQAILDPTSDLPGNSLCTVTVNANQVTDNDVVDPPNEMAANHVFSFTTVDAAPSVTSTTPTNGATNVPNDTNITINFSEPVNFGANSFAIECPFGSGSVAFSVSVSGTSTAVLDPTASLPVGVTCTVSAISSQVTDVDAFDPPNTLTPNGEDANGRPAYLFGFTTVGP